ncbi:MAG: hypothetical protein FWC78_08160 [Defluviitaleaceae bacterium]|nr:hypothetical protein [Defluviitaleaceae bacterium]
MPFPLTHLLVAGLIMGDLRREDMGAFLLGAIAPDGVHYRDAFLGAGMVDIGPAKKVTHLCPVSGERWGQITDNAGWEMRLRDFAAANRGSALHLGYALHGLTDIYNNAGLWNDFRTNHPVEAAKGYSSDYYRDLRSIDARLYLEEFKGSEIPGLLAAAQGQDLPGLVTAAEMHAIRDNLLNVQYAGVEAVPVAEYRFVTYEAVLASVKGAAEYAAGVIL